MAPSQRRQQIETMLEEDPTDSFLRYALAMELRAEGDLLGSIDRLKSLMTDTPPHGPAFFMAAQQFVQLQQIDAARTALRDGIEQARDQDDSHAASEMADLLAQLGNAGE